MPLTLSLGRPLVEWLIVVGIVRRSEMEEENLDVSGESVTVQVAYRYLSTRPYSLWANWDISIPSRRLLAARWFAEQVEGMENMVDPGEIEG